MPLRNDCSGFLRFWVRPPVDKPMPSFRQKLTGDCRLRGVLGGWTVRQISCMRPSTFLLPRSHRVALLLAAAGGVAGTGGFFLGRISYREEAAGAAAGFAERARGVPKQSVPGRGRRGSGDGGAGPQTARGEGAAISAALTSAMAAGDIRGSLLGLVGIGDPAARMTAVRAFIQSLPEARWPEVFDEFQRMESAGEMRKHQNMTRAAASTWELLVAAIVEKAPGNFLQEKLKTDAGRISDIDAESMMGAWAERDLDSAVAFFNDSLLSLKPADMQGAAAALACDFMRLDPERAVDWLASLPEATRSFCVPYALEMLSQDDPAKAARVFADHESLHASEDLARSLAQRWAASDAAGALAWANQLPPSASASALRGVLDQWAKSDIAAAAQHVEQLPPSARSAALPGLAEHAPDDMLPSLARQLAACSTDEHQLSAAASLAARWAGHDPAAASEWLIAEPASPMRDAAIRAFTRQLAENDPFSALEWAAVIGDSETRWGTLKTGVHNWLDKDPAAAREWVRSSHTLTTQDRERLLVRTGQ